MSMRDLIREALRSLESNRGRSLLTILGIVIGIAAVIAMTSLIGGVRNMLVEGLGLNAARAVQISAMYQMTPDNLDDLRRLMPEYEMIEGVAYGYADMESDGEPVSVSIVGGDSSYLTMATRVSLAEGRLFTTQEEAAGSRVVVIDRAGAQLLFGSADASVTGKTLHLGGHDYVIVGLDQNLPASNNGSNSYITVYMPTETVLSDFSDGYEYLSSVMGIAREGADIDALMEATKTNVAKVLNIPDDMIEEGVYVYSMKSQIDSMNGFMNSFSLIMGAVAGISLLVGGIGIMNMMLTNVTERIREIGVRRALGATRRDITLQFLVESAAVCVAGGVIGTLLGYLISWALTAVASSMGLVSMLGGTENAVITPLISIEAIAIAVGLSVGIGLVFGFYPARRAARLDPVECLRYQ